MNLDKASATVFAFLCAAVLAYALWCRCHVPDSFPTVESNEQKARGARLRLDLSAKLFDMGVVVLGVLWGLILTEKVPAESYRLTDLLRFAFSNILLLLSLLFHLSYKRCISTLL